jgi:hypothetical protein
MKVKKVKVAKNGVIKTVEAHQEKDYVKNGWIVINDPYQSPVNANAFVRK